MAKCPGCGAELQSERKDAPGYTPKADGTYCQRCFRLIHYDDLTVSMKTGIDPDDVMKQLESMDALILWVVDLFDFEAGMIPGINRRIGSKDIILAATKRDLLPETLSDEKAARFVFSRLKELGIQIRTLILCSRDDQESLEEIRRQVKEAANGKPVAVIGRANAGKSTLLNAMAGSQILTASRYPGTTLEFNRLEIDGQQYIDTPGIEIEHSILMTAEEKDLKTIVPQSRVKPVVFQLKGDQSFAIGGLSRIDLTGCEKASCVFYLSSRMDLHRSKLQTADSLWEKHYGKMLRPVAQVKEFSSSTTRKSSAKMDIVIDGLGWACLSGRIKTVTVHVPKGVNVTYRKAML